MKIYMKMKLLFNQATLHKKYKYKINRKVRKKFIKIIIIYKTIIVQN